MDIKQYLSQIDRLEKMIRNKLAEIYQLKVMVTGTTVKNNGDRVQISFDKDKLGTLMAKIVDMENEVDAMIDKRCNIVAQIESIPDTEMYDVLAKRYILGKSNKEIAVERKETEQNTYRLLKEALEEFEKLYGKEYLY